MVLLREERGEISTRKLKVQFDRNGNGNIKQKKNEINQKIYKNQSSMTAVETNMETSFAETNIQNTVQYQILSHKGLLVS